MTGFSPLIPTFTPREKVSTQLFIVMKTMGCKSAKLPLLLERVGVRRIKSIVYIPLIPAFSLKGEGVGTCVDTYAPREKEQITCLLPHYLHPWCAKGFYELREVYIMNCQPITSLL
jgi:hypothetical protein